MLSLSACHVRKQSEKRYDKEGAYDINRHLSGMPQYTRREVYSGNITQDSWTEPDSRPRDAQ